ncbi:MAG: response regulator [Acidisphaera sp.]|nr:response regulator [Acidisphaera sp.]
MAEAQGAGVVPTDVLVLEDDELFRTTLAGALESAGLRVREATGGREALSLLRESENFEILLADRNLALGGDDLGDGFRVAEAAMHLWPSLGVIYMTGDVEALEGRALGPRERMIRKPFVAIELIELVRGLCSALAEASPTGG